MNISYKKGVARLLLAAILCNISSSIELFARHSKEKANPCCPKPVKPCKPKHEKKCDEFFKPVDYIIVGGGTAGLTCAWALTNDKKTSVLVLEAGLNLTADPIVLNPNILETNDPLQYSPHFSGVNVTTDNTQRNIYSWGCMVGGSSGHNFMQAFRGNPELYNDWAAISGNPIWDYNHLLPLFKSQEHYIPNGTMANPEQRGFDGRLYISQATPLTSPFYQAVATGFGVPFAPAPDNNFTYDYNDHSEVAPGVYANSVGMYANQSTFTEFCQTYSCGTRCFSGNAYLVGITEEEGANPAIKPIVDSQLNGIEGRKLYVRTSCNVSRVLFDDTTATGVELIVHNDQTNKDHTYRTRAKKGVILSANSINSPAILQRSGIGKADDLLPLGINVLVDNPNVGYNATNQYGVDILIAPRSETSFFTFGVCLNDLGKGDAVTRNYTLAVAGALVPGQVLAVVGLTPFEAFLNYIDLKNFLLQPHSTGSVVIKNADPLKLPYYDQNLFSDTDGTNPYNLNPNIYPAFSQDLADCITCFLLAQKVAAAQGGGPEDIIYPPNFHYPAPYGPAEDYSLLANDALFNPYIAAHLSCTCRMSSSPADGVVDGKLRVWGTKHLYVADNSIMPRINTGSTAYPAYFIGLNMAKILGANLP